MEILFVDLLKVDLTNELSDVIFDGVDDITDAIGDFFAVWM